MSAFILTLIFNVAIVSLFFNRDLYWRRNVKELIMLPIIVIFDFLSIHFFKKNKKIFLR